METDVEDFLEHYGVKGQQWGVRRQNTKLAKVSARNEKNQQINKAQQYFSSGKAAKERDAAKNRAAIAKITKGRAEAQRIMAPIKAHQARQYATAVQTKSGAEHVALSLLSMGQYDIVLAGARSRANRLERRAERLSA